MDYTFGCIVIERLYQITRTSGVEIWILNCSYRQKEQEIPKRGCPGGVVVPTTINTLVRCKILVRAAT